MAPNAENCRISQPLLPKRISTKKQQSGCGAPHDTNGAGGASNNATLPANNLQNATQGAADEDPNKQDQLFEYLGQHVHGPFSKFGPGIFTKMRESGDRELIQSIKNDKLMEQSYHDFGGNRFTMFFNNDAVEREYRDLCQIEMEKKPRINQCTSTRVRFFSDMITSTLVTLIIFIASILILQVESITWAIVFTISFILLLTAVVIGLMYICSSAESISGNLNHCMTVFSYWGTRHVLASTFLILPFAILLSFITLPPTVACQQYMLLLAPVILHFINYNQITSLVRLSVLLSISVVALVLLLPAPIIIGGDDLAMSSNLSNASGGLPVCSYSSDLLLQTRWEFLIDMVIMIAFVFYTTRYFEAGYRLLFYSAHHVKKTQNYIESEKKKVEMLLENFIPNHVREVMQGHQQVYSKTHKKIGVIFGSIVNFNELYEEQFAGGIEFLRILSELFCDVEELLEKPKYKDIEKIKTIGTTMMLASGLNPDSDQGDSETSHLNRLMEFCIDYQNTVDAFNKDMLNFQLVLRIGFNHGEVTAGVIGSTKRLYDIWGDTVNVASRMDSTGVPGRIQVSDGSQELLKDHYNFEYIGEKFVKGKGQLKTYLLVRDDEHERKIIPNPKADYPPF